MGCVMKLKQTSGGDLPLATLRMSVQLDLDGHLTDWLVHT